MATIASIAAEYDMQPYELATYAGLDDTPQHEPLDSNTEAFVYDLLINSRSGTYCPPPTR